MIELSRRSCLAMAAGFGALGPAWAEGERPLVSAAALQADADIFQRAYAALHPGLLRYNTASEMQSRFTALRQEFAAPRSLGEAYLACSRVTAAVRCGHSFLNPYNQEGGAQALIEDRATSLPFRFCWLDGRMIVLEDSSADPALQRGAAVETIGGTPVGHILGKLAALVSIDGHNDAKRLRLLEVRGEDKWEMFDVLFPLVFPELGQHGVARLTVSPVVGGSSKSIDVQLVTHAARLEALKPGVDTKDSAEPAWRMELLNDGVAWLAMPSWALFDSKWDWKAALTADLDQLAGDPSRTLVVDLRGNGGGLDVGDVILSRLVARDTPKSGMVPKVRYRRVPDDLSPYLKTWDRSFRDWGEQAVGPDQEGFYRLTRYDADPAGEMIKREGKPFTGKLIVLADASNSSATFQFSQSVKLNGLGTVVGQTTGGNRRGINGGAFFFLRLPGSGLEIDLPLIGTFPTTPQPDAGIAPDVAVRLTRSDVSAGKDPFRSTALALASAGQT